MHGGLTGWGTEEAQLLASLRDLSPVETQLLKEVYANRFNVKLEDDIASELSGAHLEQAQAALKGDRAFESATALHRAMDGVGTDEEALMKELSSLKPGEYAKVGEAYKRRYGVELESALRRELRGDDLSRALALQAGKPMVAAAAELHKAVEGVGTDKASLRGVMKHHSPAQMQEIAREYQRLYGTTLESALRAELSGNELSEALAQVRGNPTAAKVAQIRGALERIGTDEEGIFSALDHTTAEERGRLRSEFKAQTGMALEDALDNELSGNDLERAKALLAHGKLSDVEKLRFAFEGAGTDEATIKEVLRNRSKDDVEYLRREYEARYHESLESRIHGELGGSDEFRVLQALKGRPATVEEALQNVKELDAFERSGILSGVIGAFSKEDDRIQEQLVVATFDMRAAQKDGVITPEERAAIERTLRFAEGNIDVHVETRDAVANTGATVAAVAGSTIVVVGTGGIATPGVIAAAAAVGGASYAGTKYAVQGRGYDGEGLATDVAIGAIEGTVTALTAGTATAVKNAAQQGAKQAVLTGSKAAARETFVESVGATAQDAVRPDTWAGGVAAGVANLAVSAAGTAITSGALHRAGEVRPPMMRDAAPGVTSPSPRIDAPSVDASKEAPARMVSQQPVAQGPLVDGTVALKPRNDSPLMSTEHFRFTSQSPKDWAVGLATSPEHRVAHLAPELHELRLGIPGRVRTAAELSDAHVAQVLNGQLNHVTEAQVRDLIASFGPGRTELATQVLLRLSASGNLDVMSDIAQALHQVKYSNRELYSSLNGSLADSLKYLANEKAVLRYQLPQGVRVTNVINSNSIVLLDGDTLQRLKTDTKFVKELVANKVPLVHLTGFIDGINPFNSPGLGDIKERVNRVMTQVEALRTASPSASTDELIAKSLQGELVAQLNAIDSSLARHLDVISPSQSTGNSMKVIVDSLNGSPGISEKQVYEVLAKLDAPWRPLAREAVVQLSEVQSHRSMAALAREQFEKIRSFALSEGVALDDVIFTVKKADSMNNTKSYGIATYIFKEANAGNLRPEQFVSLDKLATAAQERAGRKTLVVALDDFSGSGASLLSSGDVRGLIRSAVGPSTPIVCAPYVATTQAFDLLTDIRINNTDPHVTMIPGRVVTSMSESQLYTVDNGALRDGLKQVIGGSAYNNSMPRKTLVSMPYMGPDNNGALFGGSYFNPCFIMNAKRGVCKTDYPIDPVGTSSLEDILRREVSFVRSDLAAMAKLSPQEGLKMARRVEELTEAAQQLNMMKDAQGEIQAAINEVAMKCRGEVRRVTDAVRRVGPENSPRQLLLDFEAARELSRRLSLDEQGDDVVVEAASAAIPGGVR